MFQSALAPKDERYLQVTGSARAALRVSIRSRPEGREIQPPAAVPGAVVVFQSALAPKDERYTRCGPSIRAMMRFNPLSPRRTRDTNRRIPGPLRRNRFNPLSPRRTRDTGKGEGNAEPKDEFQSALAPKDERYAGQKLWGLSGRVSIRSRPEGREIHVEKVYAASDLVSIRSRPEGREIRGSEKQRSNVGAVSIRSRPEGREIRADRSRPRSW